MFTSNCPITPSSSFIEICTSLFENPSNGYVFNLNGDNIIYEFVSTFFNDYLNNNFDTIFYAALENNYSFMLRLTEQSISPLDASDGSTIPDGDYRLYDCYGFTGQMSSIPAGQFEGACTLTGTCRIVGQRITSPDGPYVSIDLSPPGDWFYLSTTSHYSSTSHTDTSLVFSTSFYVQMDYVPLGLLSASDTIGPYEFSTSLYL